MRCQHQFFELRDIGYSPIDTMTFNGVAQMVMTAYRGGKLVMCALCGEQRQLWENGDILFLIDGTWRKLDTQE